MKATNSQLDRMLASLDPALKTRGKLGYAAARNKRVISEALTEYLAARDQLIMDMGEAVLDENGNATGQYELKINDPNFKAFEKALSEIAEVEQKVNVMKIPPECVIDELTGEEIFALGWMIEEVDDGKPA